MDSRNLAIEAVELRKEYKGIVVVDDLNLQLEQGDIFGLIGPNGSGKTTVIRMLATLLKPSSGSVYIGGHDIIRSPEKIRGIIGYMPDFFEVYGDLKVWEYLSFFAAAYKIPKRKRIALIDDVLELTDLITKRDSYTCNLSRGMRQRLCVAKTLINDPKVLLLDDPASGLDPKARFEIREIIKELGSMGKTILLSSNILSELSDLCNKIGIIEQGKLQFSGDIDSISSQLDEGVILEINIHSGMERAREILAGRSDIGNVNVRGDVLNVQYTGKRVDMHRILAELVNENVQISSFCETTINLEDTFLRLTEGSVS